METTVKPLWKYLACAVLVFCLICCRFDETRRSVFENFSENLVCSVMYAKQNGLPIEQGLYGLGTLKVEDSAIDNDYPAYYQSTNTFQGAGGKTPDDISYTFGSYISQVGLQGHIFGLAAQYIHTPKLYWALRIGCIAALEITLFLIAWQLKKRYGIFFAATFLIVSTASPWITNFAANLYWVEFTWFLPMLLGLLCLNHPSRRGWFYPLICLAVLAKCLCGYEYISTIMVGAVLFLCEAWYTDKPERKRLLRTILGVGISCMVGFAAAYLFHAYLYGKGDIFAGASAFFHDTVLRRSLGSAADYTGTTAETLQASMFAVLGKYLWHNLAGKGTLCVLLAAVCCLAAEWRMEHELPRQKAALLVLSFLGAASWFMLGKGHSYMHTPLNFVMWHMGFLQIAVYIIAAFLWDHRILFCNEQAGNRSVDP